MVLERRLARLGLAVAVVLLALIGTSTYRYAGQQGEAYAWVTHTHRMVEALEAVVHGITEAESAVRGYAVTRDDAFLEDFEPALVASNRGFTEARTLSQDNPRQQQALHQLEPVLERRIALLRARQTELREGAAPGIPYEHRALTKQIRAMIGTAVRVEQELMVERTALAASRLETTRALSGLGMVASIGLVLFAFFFFDREMRQRRTAERRLGLLVELGELLQSCRSPSEAFEVIQRFSPTFLPGTSGRVSLLRASRNALESQAHWGDEARLGRAVFEPDDCWALRKGQAHAARGDESRMVCKHVSEPRPKATLCLPLIASGELIGSLHLAGDQKFDADLSQRAGAAGEQFALAIANLELRETLRNQSIRDPLTGLFNRRYTEATLQREIARASRDKGPLSIMLLDVDHFKRFNDEYGHEVGDTVLKQLGALLASQTRGGDVASRLGGEELLVILPAAPLEAARSKAEQLRSLVSEVIIRAHGKVVGPLTVSIGVAAYPQHGSTPEELMRAADDALYRAKHEGRNRVLAAE